MLHGKPESSTSTFATTGARPVGGVRKADQNVVCYASSFVPPEWIAAHGLRPWRLLSGDDPGEGGPVNGHEREGLCAYAADIAARAGDRVMIFATTCDQMRRLADRPTLENEKTFLMHIPSACDTPGAAGYYRSELIRLGHYLERIGGHAPSPHGILAQMERYEAGREQLIARRGHLRAREHIALTSRFFQSGELPPLAGAASPLRSGIPLMLLGSPLRPQDLDILDQIEQAGGRIAVDATDAGEREWPRPFDRVQMQADPFGELADAYFGHIPAIFRRPNQALFSWLQQKAVSSPHLRGIVFVTHPWCDLWKAELPRLHELLSVPILHLALGGSIAAHESRATRIEAFLEMIA